MTTPTIATAADGKGTNASCFEKRCSFAEGKQARQCFIWDGKPEPPKASRRPDPTRRWEREINVFRRTEAFHQAQLAREIPLRQAGIKVFPALKMKLIEGDSGQGVTFSGPPTPPKGPTKQRLTLWPWQKEERRIAARIGRSGEERRTARVRVKERQRSDSEHWIRSRDGQTAALDEGMAVYRHFYPKRVDTRVLRSVEEERQRRGIAQASSSLKFDSLRREYQIQGILKRRDQADAGGPPTFGSSRNRPSSATNRPSTKAQPGMPTTTTEGRPLSARIRNKIASMADTFLTPRPPPRPAAAADPTSRIETNADGTVAASASGSRPQCHR